MNRAILGSLTERHLMLFGTIIQLFARYELLMQEVMTTVSGADPAAIMLLTRGLNFREKRRALLDLLFHWTVPVDQYDRIGAFLLVPDEPPQRDRRSHSDPATEVALERSRVGRHLALDRVDYGVGDGAEPAADAPECPLTQPLICSLDIVFPRLVDAHGRRNISLRHISSR